MDDLSYNTERRFYGDDESQFVDIASPLGEPRGVIVSYHGGYWRAAYGLDLHDRIVEHCVGLGWAVVNAEYRRIEPGTAGVWNAMANDVLCAAAVAETIPVDGPLVALGHSAGGHLALWVAAQDKINVDAVIALAPVADLVGADRRQLSDHVTLDLLGFSATDEPLAYEAASPMHLLPLGIPQLVMHGPSDDRVPFAMAEEYVNAARVAGDDVTFATGEEIDHFTVIDPAHPRWREVDAFLDSLCLDCR